MDLLLLRSDAVRSSSPVSCPSSFSLFGVYLMAFHQAQYILNEFFTPTSRSNHNSVLSRHKAPVNNITPNGVRYTTGPGPVRTLQLPLVQRLSMPCLVNLSNTCWI